MNNPVAKIIGIDMGTKRVGVALSNVEQTFAFPHSVIALQKHVENGGLEDVVQEIELIAQKENVKQIVIGESKDFTQKENPIMKQVHELNRLLSSQGYFVVLEPEFLSSSQAARFQGKHDKIDASAATIILQSYLDRQRNHNINILKY